MRADITKRQVASSENPFSASVSIPVERNVESIGAALSEREKSWMNVCNPGGKKRVWRGGRRPPLRRPVETVVASSPGLVRKGRSINELGVAKVPPSTNRYFAKQQTSKLRMLVDPRQQLLRDNKFLYSISEPESELQQPQGSTSSVNNNNNNKTLGELMFGHFAIAQWNILGGIDRTTRLKALSEELLKQERANLSVNSNNSSRLRNNTETNNIKAQVGWFPAFGSLLVAKTDYEINGGNLDTSSLLKNISDYAQYFALAIEQTLIDHQIERETLALKYQLLETQNKELLCDLSKITNVFDESSRDDQRFGSGQAAVSAQQDGGALAKSIQLMKELTVYRGKQLFVSPIVKLIQPATLERDTMPMDQRLIDLGSERAKRDVIILDNYVRFLDFFNQILRELSKVS